MESDMRYAALHGPHLMACPSEVEGKSFEAWYIKGNGVEKIGDF